MKNFPGRVLGFQLFSGLFLGIALLLCSFPQAFGKGTFITNDDLASLQPGAVSPEILQVVRGNNAFGLALFQKISREKPRNLIFSPFSIHLAFAMPFAGASRQTALEMETVLGYPVKDHKLSADFGKYLKSFDLEGKTTPHTYELAIANRLWVQQDFPFNPKYFEFVKNVFSSEIQVADFKTNGEQVRGIINAWVAEVTKEKIKDLIPSGILTDLTRLVLVNAVYFKGKWASEFSPKDTKDEPFFLPTADQVAVPMMFQQTRYQYFEDDRLQVVALPYKGKELDMCVFLPREKNGLANLEADISEAQIGEWLQKAWSPEVKLWLPRFKVETDFSLVPFMKELGVNDAFKEGVASFDRMLDPVKAKPKDNLFISAALHKAFIAVDEEGTEAAAATAITASIESCSEKPEEPKSFRADHPFLYCLRHRATGAILFFGRVVNPKES